MNNRIKQSIEVLLLIIMLAGFIYIGGKEYKKDASLTDAEKFSTEYPDIPKDNIFNYLDNSELESFLNNGTGILFLASPTSAYSQAYAKYLNEAANLSNIETINYYNIKRAKEAKNRYYQALTTKLTDELICTDISCDNLFTPMTIFLKEGKILAIDNTTAIISSKYTPENYWTSENISSFEVTIMNNYRLL